MHKKTREGEMVQKLARNDSLKAKREILCGVALEIRRPIFIEAVGSPSGRLINIVWMRAASKTCGLDAPVRASNLTVWPSKTRASGRLTLPSDRRIGVSSGHLSYTRPDAKRGQLQTNNNEFRRITACFFLVLQPRENGRIFRL
jgi:hypothetical protein